MNGVKLTRAQAVAHCKKMGGNSKARGRIRRLYDDGGYITLDYGGRVVVVLKKVTT